MACASRRRRSGPEDGAKTVEADIALHLVPGRTLSFTARHFDQTVCISNRQRCLDKGTRRRLISSAGSRAVSADEFPYLMQHLLQLAAKDG
jgi:hypothetical protein